MFITIACGAISGFHALVASGTTPKMIDKERHCRPIGYGAMLMEGLVGITALIAACVMPPEDYVAINTDPKIALVASAETRQAGLARSVEQLGRADSVLTAHDRKLLGLNAGRIDHQPGEPEASRFQAPRALEPNARGARLRGRPNAASTPPRCRTPISRASASKVKELPALSRGAGEVVAARTGGGVSLAVGMARVFSGLPGMSTLLAYWYHFAIMFEALFILTTIDTGTRIGRFLMQEFLGSLPRRARPLDESRRRVRARPRSSSRGWTYFILTGSISTIWPMFGIANQLLACAALCVGTTIILREAPRKALRLDHPRAPLFRRDDDDHRRHPERSRHLLPDVAGTGDARHRLREPRRHEPACSSASRSSSAAASGAGSPSPSKSHRSQRRSRRLDALQARHNQE